MRKVVVLAISVGALAVPFGSANAGTPNDNSSLCGKSSSSPSEGTSLQDRADAFFGGSIQALQKAHCGSENANPQGPKP